MAVTCWALPCLAETAKLTPIPDDIQITEKLGTSVPLDLEFVDDRGETVTIKSYVERGQPLVLVPVYYNCPLLCNITLNRLIDTLKDMPYVPGEGYQILTFSIDPREGPELAKEKKESHLKSLNRPGAGRGWHFLTGSRDSIKALTAAIGFGYRYDQDKMEYLHRAGLIGLDATGRVTQYYHGAYTPPVQLTIGLIKAGDGEFGTLKERIWAGLFVFDPSQRKFILNENLVLTVLGAMVLVMVALTFVAFRRPRRSAT